MSASATGTPGLRPSTPSSTSSAAATTGGPSRSGTSSAWSRRYEALRMGTASGQRGQGLVEFTLVLPIVLVLVVSVAELGFIFGKLSSLGYASREGARTALRSPWADATDPVRWPTRTPQRRCLARGCRAAHPRVARFGHRPWQGAGDPHLQGRPAAGPRRRPRQHLAVCRPGVGPEVDPGRD